MDRPAVAMVLAVVLVASCLLPASAFLSGPTSLALRAGSPGQRQGSWPSLCSHQEHEAGPPRRIILTASHLPAPETPTSLSPRRFAVHLLGTGLLSVLIAEAGPVKAFENAVPEYAKYAKKPKRRGDAPKDLGVSQRTINRDSLDADPKTFEGLRQCDGKTNCFSTTGDDLPEDRITKGADTLIKPWLPPAGDASPFTSLVAQVKAYEPGQGFIDGGGFEVVKETDSYLYVQFEALKKGYIDDVEFFISKDRQVQVRSGSRVGSSDFGVNAKRLNYIAAGLRDKGWTIDDITPQTHPDYFYAAADAADQTFDQDRRKGTEVEKERLQRPNFGNRAVLK